MNRETFCIALSKSEKCNYAHMKIIFYHDAVYDDYDFRDYQRYDED